MTAPPINLRDPACRVVILPDGTMHRRAGQMLPAEARALICDLDPETPAGIAGYCLTDADSPLWIVGHRHAVGADAGALPLNTIASDLIGQPFHGIAVLCPFFESAQ